MPTPKQLAASQLYANLMEEVKVRFECIETAIQGKTTLPNQTVREFCYLQLRILCELIALGCLVAHEDITAKTGKTLLKEYAADKIIKKLELLHSDFYPHPVTFTVTPPSSGNPGSVHLDRKSSGFLTKANLKTLYRKSGDILHRGTMKNINTPIMDVDNNYTDIVKWTNKIIGLLDGHHIASTDKKLHHLCILANANDSGRVQVSLAESPK